MEDFIEDGAQDVVMVSLNVKNTGIEKSCVEQEFGKSSPLKAAVLILNVSLMFRCFGGTPYSAKVYHESATSPCQLQSLNS